MVRAVLFFVTPEAEFVTGQEVHTRVPPKEVFKGHSELEIHEVALDTDA